MYRIYQFKHCLKGESQCAIKNRTISKFSVDDLRATVCDVHSDFQQKECELDLKPARRFCFIVCFLLSLIFKILKSGNGIGDFDRSGKIVNVKNAVCNILFNFIEHCPQEY
jgi:hypothetical protein